MKVQIDSEALKNLERKADKLEALENGGVNNWDGYECALKEYHKQEKRDQLIVDACDDLAQAFGWAPRELPEEGERLIFNDYSERVEQIIVAFAKEYNAE